MFRIEDPCQNIDNHSREESIRSRQYDTHYNGNGPLWGETREGMLFLCGVNNHGILL